MTIEPFFDPRTSTLTYVVFDPATRDALVIDPVLDYEPGGAGEHLRRDSVDAVKCLELRSRPRAVFAWHVAT